MLRQQYIKLPLNHQRTEMQKQCESNRGHLTEQTYIVSVSGGSTGSKDPKDNLSIGSPIFTLPKRRNTIIIVLATKLAAQGPPEGLSCR